MGLSMVMKGCCLNIFTKQTFLIPILGIMFVVSSVSVILQVVKFKQQMDLDIALKAVENYYDKD